MTSSEFDADTALTTVKAGRGPSQHVHPDVAGFWNALSAGHLALQRCGECSTIRFPLSTHCHVCLSGDYAWERIDPRGTVNVAVKIHEGVSTMPYSGASLPEPWKSMAPFVTGAVDMEVGVRLPGRILCSCDKALSPGTPVTAVLLDTRDGAPVHGFVHDCNSSTSESSNREW